MATLETAKDPNKKQSHPLWSKMLKKIYGGNYFWSKVTEEASKLSCSSHSLANKAEAHSLIPMTHDQQKDRRGVKCVPDKREGYTKERCLILNSHLKPLHFQ